MLECGPEWFLSRHAGERLCQVAAVRERDEAVDGWSVQTLRLFQHRLSVLIHEIGIQIWGELGMEQRGHGDQLCLARQVTGLARTLRRYLPSLEYPFGLGQAKQRFCYCQLCICDSLGGDARVEGPLRVVQQRLCDINSSSPNPGPARPGGGTGIGVSYPEKVLEALPPPVRAQVVDDADNPVADAEPSVMEAIAIEVRSFAVGGKYVLPESVKEPERLLREAGCFPRTARQLTAAAGLSASVQSRNFASIRSRVSDATVAGAAGISGTPSAFDSAPRNGSESATICAALLP